MPRWVHARAKHILAKNPDMEKGMAFALATQQSHAAGKSPKGFGTEEGKEGAKVKYTKPGKMVKKPNPGSLKTPKLASIKSELHSPRFYSNLRGYLTGEGREERLSHHGKIRKSRKTVGQAAREGWSREKSAAAMSGLKPSAMWSSISGVASRKPAWRAQAGFTPTGMKTPAQKLQKSMDMGKFDSSKGLKPLNIKVGQVLVELTKAAFNMSQYSGDMEMPSMRYASGIPSWKEPPVKTAGPPPPRGKLKKANIASPSRQLAKAQSVGAPRASAPPGPSIAQIAKPTGYGKPMSGATKGNNII